MSTNAPSSFSFSYTAPAVSPEQEHAELEALTDAERKELERDLHPDDAGLASVASSIQAETPEMNARGVAMMFAAVEGMPHADKKAYEEAVRQSPELVERESDPVAFLRCERWDVRAAAKRYLSYWTIRKRLFGDQALLPMTLAGAMAPDIPTLERGIVVLLPSDDFGRPVEFVDRSKVKKSSDVDVTSIVRTQQGLFASSSCWWIPISPSHP